MRKYVPLFEEVEFPPEFTDADFADDSIEFNAEKFFNEVYRTPEGTAIFSREMKWNIKKIKLNDLDAKLRMAHTVYDEWIKETDIGRKFMSKLLKRSEESGSIDEILRIRNIVWDLIMARIPFVLPFFE